MESCHSVTSPIITVVPPTQCLPAATFSTLGHLIKIIEQLDSQEELAVVLQKIVAECEEGKQAFKVRLDLDTVTKVSELLGRLHSSLNAMATDKDGTKRTSSATSIDALLKMIQGYKLPELEMALLNMEDRKLSLLQENILLNKKLKELEPKFKPLQEKNKKFLEKNMELTTANRSLKDQVKNVVEENKKLKEVSETNKKKAAQLSRQLSQEKLERGNLEIKLQEMDALREEVSEQSKAIQALKQACAEKDRRMEILQHRKKRRLRKSYEQISCLSPSIDEDQSIDSELSHSSMSGSTVSDEDLLEELPGEDVEKRYRKLMKEHLLTEKSVAQLHTHLDCNIDSQRYGKLKSDLETDLFVAQCRIEQLDNICTQAKVAECSWVKEKDQLCTHNQLLKDKLRETDHRLRETDHRLCETDHQLHEAQEVIEHLEFQVLEFEECNKASEVSKCDATTATDEEENHDVDCLQKERYDEELKELRRNEAALKIEVEMAERSQERYRDQIRELQAKLAALMEEQDGGHVIEKLKETKQYVNELENSMQELQEKVTSLQRENSLLRQKSDKQEQALLLTPDERLELLQVQEEKSQEVTSLIAQTGKAARVASLVRSETVINAFIEDEDSQPNMCETCLRLKSQLVELQEENDVLKYELVEKNSADETDSVKSEDATLVDLRETCESLTEKLQNSEVTERQLKDRLRLAERTINDLETSEGNMRDKMEEAVKDYEKARKQCVRLQKKIRELKEINMEKEAAETALLEKLNFLKDAEVLSSQKIAELEATKKELQQHLDIKEELMADLQLVETLKKKVVTLETENNDLSSKLIDLEENNDKLRENWTLVAEEEADRLKCLEEKLNVMENKNRELKSKLQEKDQNEEMNVSLASELSSACEESNDQVLEEMKGRVSDLEIVLRTVTEEKDSRIEALEDQIGGLKENEIKLSETLAEMENEEQMLRKRLELYEKAKETEKSDNPGSTLVKLEDKLSEMRSSQENLLDRIDSMEDHEDDLKQRLVDMEARHEKELEKLEKEIAEYQKLEENYYFKIEEFERSNEDLRERVEEMERQEDEYIFKIEQLERRKEEMSARISELEKIEDENLTKMEELEKSREEVTSSLSSKIEELEHDKEELKNSLSNRIEELERNKESLKQTFSTRIEELEKHEKELMEKVESLEQSSSIHDQENSELVKKVTGSDPGKVEVAKSVESFVQVEKDVKENLRTFDKVDGADLEKLEEQNKKFKEEIEDLNSRVEEFEELKNDLLNKVQTFEKENKSLTDKLKKQEKKIKKSQRNGNLDDYDSLARELVTYKNEVEQLRVENNDLSDRVFELDNSERELLEKLENYDKDIERLHKLEEKSGLFEDAECKLMERIVELEESELKLQEELTLVRQNVNSESKLGEELSPLKPKESSERKPSVDSICESGKAIVRPETADKSIGTCDFMELGNAEPGKPVSGLFGRIQDLEAENEELTNKLSHLTGTDAQVRQLSEKVKLLEQSEDSLMERVMELEDEEDKLKRELTKFRRSVSSQGDLEEELESLHEKEKTLDEKVTKLEHEKLTLKNSVELSDKDKADLALRLASLQKSFESEKKKVESLLKSEEKIMKSLTHEKKAVKELENELSSTQEKLEELQTEYEQKLSLAEENEKLVREELTRQLREKELIRKKSKEFEKSCSELEDEIESCKISEARMFHRHQQLITHNEELEQKLVKLAKFIQEKGIKADDNENVISDQHLQMSDNPKLAAESPMVSSIFNEAELEVLRTEGQVTESPLLGSMPLDMLKKVKDFDQKEKDYRQKIEELENKNIKLIRKMKVLEGKKEDMKSEIKEMQRELTDLRESTSSLEFTGKSTDDDSDDQLDAVDKMESDAKDNQNNSEANCDHHSEVFRKNDLDICYDNMSHDQLLLSTKLLEEKKVQDNDRIVFLEDQVSAFQGMMTQVVAMVTEESFEAYIRRTETFQLRECQKESEEEKFQKSVQQMLASVTGLRTKYQALVTSLRKSGDVPDASGDHVVPSNSPVLEQQVEATLWKQLETPDVVAVTSPGQSLSLQTDQTTSLPNIGTLSEVEQFKRSDKDFLNNYNELEKENNLLKKKIEFLENLESEFQGSKTAMMDKPEDMLRERIRELEKLEKHLKQQVYDLEQDRDELHEIARKDKNLIHDQNVQLRELQLSEKNLKVQLNRFEQSENSLYAKLDSLEDENMKLQDRIKELEILEGRLKDLVKKYKLDEEILATKSTQLESSVQAMGAKEDNLKQKVQNLETEKNAFSERSEYLHLRLKELETAETDLVQKVRNHENTEMSLQNRLAELEVFGANAQARIAELEAINIDITQKLHHAMGENSALTQHIAQLQHQTNDFERELLVLRDSDVKMKQELDSLRKSEVTLQKDTKEFQMKDVDSQGKLRQLEQSEAILKDKLSKLQRSENTLKHRLTELENSGIQAPVELTPAQKEKLPRKLEDCQRRIIVLQARNTELESQQQQQYQEISGNRAVVQVPQQEYKLLQTKARLLEQTELQMDESERLNAHLQQTVEQLREGKDVCGHEVEVDVLRKRLQQANKAQQMLQDQLSQGQWGSKGPYDPKSGVVLSSGGTPGGNVARIPRDLIDDLVSQLPGGRDGLDPPRDYDAHSDASVEGEFIKKVYTSKKELQVLPDGRIITLLNAADNQRSFGSVSSRPKGYVNEKDRILAKRVKHLERQRGQGPSPEDTHWREIESRRPEAKISRGNRDWINVGKATSMYASAPKHGSHLNRDEELELGLNLMSETESQVYTQNDTDSGEQGNKFPQNYNRNLRDVNSLHGSSADSQAPPLPQTMPPAFGALKATDSFADSLYLPGSVQGSADEFSELDREVLLRTGGQGRGPHTKVPPTSMSIESVPDSGRGTGTTSVPSLGTPGFSLRERIAHIERQLTSRESDSGRELLNDTDITSWKAKVQESNRKLELSEKENKHIKNEINKLEKELEEKNRLYLILEAFLNTVGSVLQDKNIKNEREIIQRLEKEVEKARSQLTEAGDRDDDAVKDAAALQTELSKRERELSAKRNEVDSLMCELRQWQEECRTIEDMRSNALDSLRTLEVEVAELQNADKQLKELKDEYNTLRGQFQQLSQSYKNLEVVYENLQEVREERDDLDIEVETLKSKVKLQEGQLKIMDQVVEEKRELQEEIYKLQDRIRELQKYELENTSLEDKVKGTTNMLNERMKKVNELTDELHKLRMDLTKLEQENYKVKQANDERDNLQARVDEMEGVKSRTGGAVGPLKARVAHLVQKCNEKDVPIKRLVQELRKLRAGAKPSPLLEELCRLEMPGDEDFNHNRVRLNSSSSSLNDSFDQISYLSDTELLRDVNNRRPERPRSADFLSRHGQRHHRPSAMHLPRIHGNSGSPTYGGTIQNNGRDAVPNVGSLPSNPYFTAILDYDPSLFSRSGRPRLEIPLKEGDKVKITGPVDQFGYYEAEVNGRVGLVPANYLQPGQAGAQTHRHSRQQSVPDYLDASPERIAQMYNHIQQARTPLQGNFLPLGNESGRILQEIASIENIPFTAGNVRSMEKDPVTAGKVGPHGILNGHGEDVPRRITSPRGPSRGNTPRQSKPAIQGPPDMPGNFHVERIVGNSSLMLAWQPPALDHLGCSNGCKVTGYRVYMNNKLLVQPNSPQLAKTVVEQINIHKHHRFGIETLSAEGLISELSEIMYEGVEVSSESASDTEPELDLSAILDSSEYKNGPTRTFMGVYDYDPAKHSPQDHAHCELDFSAGDVITVFGKQRPDGFYYGEINGRRGLVPAFFMEEVPQAPPRMKKNKVSGKDQIKSSGEKQKKR